MHRGEERPSVGELEAAIKLIAHNEQLALSSEARDRVGVLASEDGAERIARPVRDDDARPRSCGALQLVGRRSEPVARVETDRFGNATQHARDRSVRRKAWLEAEDLVARLGVREDDGGEDHLGTRQDRDVLP